MTAQEKAQELVDKVQWGYRFLTYKKHKELALKWVDHILTVDIGFREFHEADLFYKFWEEVKIEIKKL